MTAQPGPQAATLGQSYPMPVFASVRVEFADGSFREFCIRKPLRTEIDIPAPAHGLPSLHDADLGALPPALIPPELPRISVRIQAGISRDGQVITIDSRRTMQPLTAARMLSTVLDITTGHALAEACALLTEDERSLLRHALFKTELHEKPDQQRAGREAGP